MTTTKTLRPGGYLILLLALSGAVAAATTDADTSAPPEQPPLAAGGTATEDEDAAAGAPAVVYRWRNRHGEVQYTDFEPEDVPSEQVHLDPAAGWEGAPVLERSGTAPADPASGNATDCAAARAELAAAHDPAQPEESRQSALAKARAAVLENCQPSAF